MLLFCKQWVISESFLNRKMHLMWNKCLFAQELTYTNVIILYSIKIMHYDCLVCLNNKIILVLFGFFRSECRPLWIWRRYESEDRGCVWSIQCPGKVTRRDYQWDRLFSTFSLGVWQGNTSMTVEKCAFGPLRPTINQSAFSFTHSL